MAEGDEMDKLEKCLWAANRKRVIGQEGKKPPWLTTTRLGEAVKKILRLMDTASDGAAASGDDIVSVSGRVADAAAAAAAADIVIDGKSRDEINRDWPRCIRRD